MFRLKTTKSLLIFPIWCILLLILLHLNIKYTQNNLSFLNTMEENIKMLNVCRNQHPEDTIITIGEHTIGGGSFAIIAGPCAIESGEQMLSIGRDVKSAGARFLRGGAFKPRVSPYSFQGLGDDGIRILKEISDKINIPVVAEILSEDKINFFSKYVDIIQVGSRNMHNYSLLKALGKLGKPILLKRNFGATIDELLFSAEYLMTSGTENIVLCERGIRTFERATRNTLDISAIPVIKKLSHLPVIVDPSHAGGMDWLISPLSKAALAAGADGIMIEVHNDPSNAKSDGAQSITPEAFRQLVEDLKPLARVLGKVI